MLKIYNKLHTAVGHLSDYKDLKVESTVADGDKTLSFTLLNKDFDLQCEYYIRTETDEYIVKEIDSDSDGNFTVVAALNLEELEQEQFQTFVLSTEVTIATAASTAIQWTGYTVATSDVTKLRKAGMVMCNARQVITNLCIAFMCEPVYDTINKTISFYQYRGSDRGAYLMSGLNLKKLSKKQSTYDFFTRIIPIGANGLTIEEVNSGRNYLENFQYASKILTYIWKDENYTDATALKEDAELYLNDLSKPAVSYSVDLLDLAKQSGGQYDVLAFGLGDNVTLIDSTTGTREKQRIKKLTEYPEEWWRNTAEIGNTTLTFEEMQSKYNDAMNIVNFALDSTGNYTGTINVSDVLHFDDGVAASRSIAEINQKFVAIDGKNFIFYQDTVPPTTGRKLNDAWFDTSAGGKMHYWNGAAWQENQFGTDAIEDHAIIADKILVNTALANEIFAQNITASGTITGGKFKGASANSYIESATYAYTSGNYSDSGIHIDLSSQGYIRAKNFAIDSSGNAYLKGRIEAGSGNIAGWNITASNGSTEGRLYKDVAAASSADGKRCYIGMRSDFYDSSQTIPYNPVFWVHYDNAFVWYVRSNGYMYAKNADIEGKITATSGAIGGWNVNSAGLYGTKSGMSTSGYAFYAGETNNAHGATASTNCTFGVAHTGEVYSIDRTNNIFASMSAGSFRVNYTAASASSSLTYDTLALTMGTNPVMVANLTASYLILSKGSTESVYVDGINAKVKTAGRSASWLNAAKGDSALAVGAMTGTGLNPVASVVGANGYWTHGVLLSDDSYSFGYLLKTRTVNGVDAVFSFGADGTFKATNFDGMIKNYNGNYRTAVTTVTADGNMVSALQMQTATRAQINGQSGTAGSSTAWYNISVSSSDRRLKENIKDSALDALALVDQLRLRSFDWKSDKNHWDVGFVADEVYDIDQHLAIKPDDEESEYWSINDFYLLGVLTKAVQEMSAKIKELERRISA